ncbi:hyphally-regulated protein-like [Camellia sinensis]|uniref:hyphally-regulated protein-like n=1 Tax=Camellia sinensis TaxID=4442 RepID=UPI001035522C|nr:hyphally-regulated protein-like [Camellia sinensis]
MMGHEGLNSSSFELMSSSCLGGCIVWVEIERIEIGDFKGLGALSGFSEKSYSGYVSETFTFSVSAADTKPKSEKVIDNSSAQPIPSTALPDLKNDDLEEQLDIENDDEDAGGASNGGGNATEKEFHTGIDINVPHQNDTDDEIADVDVSDDEDKGPNAAEALRAQVNAEERAEQTSSSSGSSGSESSGSGSGSSSGSGTGSGTSSSDSESDGNSVNSI